MNETAGHGAHALGPAAARVTTAETLRREAQAALRERIWSALREVARPDARFHWDFTSFIPDFEGSHHCVDSIRGLDAYRRAPLLFITPDNSLEGLRVAAMQDGKPFLMTTHGIVRGFLLLEPQRVPAEDRRYAATLDGIERYAHAVTLAQIQSGPPIDLLVTGASAMTVAGVRFGKGHGYFDLEWAMLSEIGALTPTSEIVAVGHDCQVTDASVLASPFGSLVDWIVTPSRLIRISHAERPRGRIYWDALAPELRASIPVLAELRELLTARQPGC
jgi:5-formyltetrahydrofolate cyclo-ligase